MDIFFQKIAVCPKCKKESLVSCKVATVLSEEVVSDNTANGKISIECWEHLDQESRDKAKQEIHSYFARY